MKYVEKRSIITSHNKERLHTVDTDVHSFKHFAKSTLFITSGTLNIVQTYLKQKKLTAEKSFNFGISPSNLNVSAIAFIKSNLTSSFLSTAYLEKTQSMYL